MTTNIELNEWHLTTEELNSQVYRIMRQQTKLSKLPLSQQKERLNAKWLITRPNLFRCYLCGGNYIFEPERPMREFELCCLCEDVLKQCNSFFIKYLTYIYHILRKNQ